MMGTVSDAFDLDRFVTAQDREGTYAAALAELRAGRKRTHWMWFVFPQVVGLGRSGMAEHYGVDGLAEARAYLVHPVLGPRLLECARALTDLPDRDPVRVLGHVDAMKLRSSMTLFARAADDHERAPFAAVLDQYYEGEEDPATLARL
jgi:uncharacterized protein (DUF1810 family)